MLRATGLTNVRVNVGARRTGDPFTVIVASGVKPPKPARSSSTFALRATADKKDHS
jgi:hypothetical protein